MTNLCVESADPKLTSKGVLCLLQEPYTLEGQPKLLPKSYQYHFGGTSPRAMIIATKEINLMKINDVSTRDMTVCLWTTGVPAFPKVLVCSVYMDKNINVLTELPKCIAYAKGNKLPVLIGADSNTHSPLWGCDITDDSHTPREESGCCYQLL